jgi:phosphonate transport system permease protein
MPPEAAPAPRIWPVPGGRLGRWRAVLYALLLAALCLPFADLAVTAPSPGRMFAAIGAGFLSPDFAAIGNLGEAVAMTLAVAFAGVAIGAVAGFVMALGWRWRMVRLLSLSLRGVHELIWALLIMTVTGPTPPTAVIALALAYSGIFAKVFAEILEEIDQRPRAALPNEGRGLSGLIYATIVPALPALWSYLAYRVECGIRSSAVLGFVGLPTLGFELDTLFKQSRYDGAAAVLLITYGLIVTAPLWLRRPLLPLYVLGSIVYVWSVPRMAASGEGLWRLLTVDIVPAPLRGADLATSAPWLAFSTWFGRLAGEQLLPGIAATLVLGVLAVVATGLVAILAFPLIVTVMAGRVGGWFGHALLVVARSTPEYMLVFVAVQALGPSMLPAIIALSLHNGAIIAHLIGRQAERMVATLRADRPRGLNLYAYELVPRLSSPFFAFLLYRAEIILRESMILGILGIATLGFFIDSAISELRLDRAMVLIAGMIATTALVDKASRWVRRRMGVTAVSGQSGW